MALLIYTSDFNARKEYVFDHIFKNILSIAYQITEDLEFFKVHQDAKISFSETPISDLSFISHPFINEKGIHNRDLAFADWDGLKIPFSVKNSAFSFDVFAATFFFLSRYEEYQIKERDQYNRFEGKNALAFKNEFVTRPLIDEWAYSIADKIKEYYPNLQIKARKFQFIPTLDIDRAFYYEVDHFPKNHLKKAKLLLKLDLKSLKKDPFDVYKIVSNWDKKYQLNTIYFFLMGCKHENDVAVNYRNLKFRKKIFDIVNQHQIGIHPSFFSHLNTDEVKLEKQSLEEISSINITKSRQHYLLLQLPKTYRDLIAVNISDDYTLAYADVAGFRASTCTPFFWYDLEKEEITILKLHPTAVMDQTLKRYMALSPQQAEVKLAELIQNVKNINGTFISLWHNESINDFGVWKGWQKVYLKMLEMGL